ncbi:hypothetical protein W911_06860 [Hyphomicrobium nitrativorans NL23]|uniref:Uncharacterized protein n=1 Tax=Hyphomicrobium nitrativorans NL23 TaxID=1029756 RepID=V5SHP4_9HYPH|nr:hypothetical protein W911_06860 [Hyphomicrobium nitrativorans NL23]
MGADALASLGPGDHLALLLVWKVHERIEFITLVQRRANHFGYLRNEPSAGRVPTNLAFGLAGLRGGILDE